MLVLFLSNEVWLYLILVQHTLIHSDNEELDNKVFKLNSNGAIAPDCHLRFMLRVLLPKCMQILDVAVSLAKVADADRSLGNEDVAVNGFQEGIKLLEALTLNSKETGLEQRVGFPCIDFLLLLTEA